MSSNFDKKVVQQPIHHKDITVANLELTTNQIDDAIFFTFAHTPLVLGHIHNSGKKLIACLSNHGFSITKNHTKYTLQASGLLARADNSSSKNIKKILDSYDNLVVVVSQIGKKYYDRETLLDNYRPRIFCMLPGKEGIINKFPTSRKSKVSTRKV